MADETQDESTTVQLSICIRYVNSACEVCEEFIGFITVQKTDAQTISDALLSVLLLWGLDMSCLVGQGYDGASVMSAGNGVQGKVRAQYPKAIYIHCRAHVLNLAISSGCTSVPSIRDLFDDVGKLTWFMFGSAKRKELFLKVACSDASEQDQELIDLLTSIDSDDFELPNSASEIIGAKNKKTVPKFCATRWSARITTLSAILAKYVTVIGTLEEIRDNSTGEVTTACARP